MISRRAALRGLGVVISLPWLEAMHRTTAIASSVAGPPVRLGFFYVPNGVHMPYWRPGGPVIGGSVIGGGSTAGFERNAAGGQAAGGQTAQTRRSLLDEPLGDLPPILSPLASKGVADRVSVISNLEAKHCYAKGAGHEPAGGGFLVGAQCKHSEEPEVGGVSVDQLAARHLGVRTPVDSLALGIDPGHRGDHGFSGTYLSHISWRSKTTPATLELNPRLLFDRLFHGRPLVKPNWDSGGPSAANRGDLDPVTASILDLVREDTRGLQRQLGFADRRRLEEYLEGLRDIERRVQASDADPHCHHKDSFDEDPSARALHDGESADRIPRLIIPDGHGIPESYCDHVDLMLDILTLAFQTDTTRVASFMFSYEKSGRSYREIQAPGAHHTTSHHQGDADKHAELVRINRHHITLFARMLHRMSKISEGEGTLLDHVAFLYGSGISDGDKHNHDNLPVLVAGGAGGKFRGGRHIAPEQATPICNVYLEMLRAAGIDQESFGDSTDGFSSLA